MIWIKCALTWLHGSLSALLATKCGVYIRNAVGVIQRVGRYHGLQGTTRLWHGPHKGSWLSSVPRGQRCTTLSALCHPVPRSASLQTLPATCRLTDSSALPPGNALFLLLLFLKFHTLSLWSDLSISVETSLLVPAPGAQCTALRERDRRWKKNPAWVCICREPTLCCLTSFFFKKILWLAL